MTATARPLYIYYAQQGERIFDIASATTPALGTWPPPTTWKAASRPGRPRPTPPAC